MSNLTSKVSFSFRSGPNLNSASRTRVSDDRSLQSSSLHPDPNSSVLSDKDSASCDLKRCNNHGRCIAEGQTTRCLCQPGYKGPFCQEQTRRSHPAVIMVAFCLVSAVIVAVFVFSKRYCVRCPGLYSENKKQPVG